MNSNPPTGAPDSRNLILAIALATAIMFGWQYFYEAPRQRALQQAQKIEATAAHTSAAAAAAPHVQPHEVQVNPGDEVHAARISIVTPRLQGSIALRGGRLDDLILSGYRESTAADAPAVQLLNKSDAEHPYFIETGLLPADAQLRVPDAKAVWKADHDTLTPERPVTLSWDNGSGLTFIKKIAIDDGYLFTVTTTVKNTTSVPVTLYPYGLISRFNAEHHNGNFLSHLLLREDGPIAVSNNILQDDITYGTLHEEGTKKLDTGTGWVGFGDKFWLTAIIPTVEEKFEATFTHVGDAQSKRYQADLRGQKLVVPAKGEIQHEIHLFTGAKEVKLLDRYATADQIPLFDRAVNFGSLYFLTKPMFQLLSYFYGLLGNFGLAILLLTVVIKAALFPLANKSMTAMSHMKMLTPKMQELKERHGQDRMKLHQEMAALYKREKVNPAAGCLPLLIQIPIFLALYRVLSVTIEMRQAPFYGWIHDLSVADPSNLFTAFGLLAWSPPTFLHLGVLPILMCVTMVIQQRYNPKPTDEMQAMMMNYMPYFFLIIFATLPAGLVLYSVWNNILTILQQLYINRGLRKKGLL